VKIFGAAVKALRKKERQDEIQLTAKILVEYVFSIQVYFVL
jgi:hypothetical protein